MRVREERGLIIKSIVIGLVLGIMLLVAMCRILSTKVDTPQEPVNTVQVTNCINAENWKKEVETIQQFDQVVSDDELKTLTDSIY